MIKKIILITGLMLSANLWADMDYTCSFFFSDSIEEMDKENIEILCERNNIFRAFGFDEEGLHKAIAQYCRFDREIDFYRSEKPETYRGYYLTCVLYDDEPRKSIGLP